MKKWIIRWNAGFGDAYEVIEAESEEKATEHAYESWKEEAESQADYEAVGWTEELAEEHGV